MLKHRLSLAHIVIVRNHLIKNRPVAGFLDVSGNGKDQPQRVIGEISADVGVTLLGKGLVLMVAAAVRELRGSNIDDTLLRAVRNLVHEAENILVGISKSHAAADSRLEVGSGTGKVERNHALILVPDVNHAVDLVVGGGNIQNAEEFVPCGAKLCHACRNLGGGVVFVNHGKGFHLVDGLAVCLKFLVNGHLHIAEDENKGLAFARGKSNLLVMGSNRSPAVREGVGCLAGKHGLRIAETVVKSDEGITVGIIAVDGLVYRVESIVIAAVSVFRLMINDRAVHLNASGGKVSLEVVAVILCIPEAPLGEGEKTEGFRGSALVGKNELLNLSVVILGNEEGGFRLQTVLFTGDNRIPHTVTAFIAVELGFNG